jgi:hypothetical protein
MRQGRDRRADQRTAETVLHLHIPRTGGTAVAQQLYAAFRKGMRHHYTTEQALTALLARGTNIDLVTGHFLWGLHSLFANPIYFVVLRDPVERVRSVYDFIKVNPGHKSHQRFKDRSLLKVLSGKKATNTQFANGQVRQLCAGRGRSIERADLEQAWAHLCQPNVVVGFTDEINRGLQQLSERVRLEIPPCDTRVNAAPRGEVDASTREIIEHRNSLDIELYERARQRFAQPQTI